MGYITPPKKILRRSRPLWLLPVCACNTLGLCCESGGCWGRAGDGDIKDLTVTKKALLLLGWRGGKNHQLDFLFFGGWFCCPFHKVYYDTPCLEHLFGLYLPFGRFFSEQKNSQNTEISPGIWKSPFLGAILWIDFLSWYPGSSLVRFLLFRYPKDTQLVGSLWSIYLPLGSQEGTL